MSRWQEHIHRMWARLTGHSELDGTYLNTRAVIPTDDRLLNRLRAARRIPQPNVERKTPESEFLKELREAVQRNTIDYDRTPPPV